MRNTGFKIIMVCLFILTAAFAFAGCTAPQLAKPTPLTGVPTYKVTGECNISINGNIITVSGKTDLDPGVFLNISVVGQNGMTIDSVTVTQKNANEQISHDFTIDGKYEGVNKVVGYITCAPTLYGKQPPERDGIYQKYGNKFEYIDVDTKNYIWGNDGVIILFASDMADLPR